MWLGARGGGICLLYVRAIRDFLYGVGLGKELTGSSVSMWFLSIAGF
jgi:hypothetical protein